MKPIMISAWLCAASVVLPVRAQTQDEHGQQNPAISPRNATPSAVDTAALGEPASKAYSSPLARYRKYVEPAISPWLESNAQVASKGGWKAYAREDSQDNTGSPTPAAPASSPLRADDKPATPHGGHSH